MTGAPWLALVLLSSTPPAPGLPLRMREAEALPVPALAARLALAPAPISRGTGALDGDERRRRDDAVRALLEADALATESPETAEPALVAALRAFAELAPLVDDPEAQQARLFALLSLARTYLVLDRREDASAVIDEALRVARGETLPVEQFGPDLVALRDELRDAGPRTGRLEVECSVPCRIWVDERAFDPEAPRLREGTARVWVEASEPGRAVRRESVRIDAGATTTLRYEVEAPALEPGPAPGSRPSPPPRSSRRLLPRWVSRLGLGLGIGAAAGGGVLIAVDHRCPDLSDPRTTPCPRILDTDAGGWVLVGLGGAVAITSAVILALDERRARRSR